MASARKATLRYRARFAADGSPSADDLTAINGMKRVLEPLAAEDVIVRECDAISTRELRGYMEGVYLPEASIRAIVALAYDTPMLCNHDNSTSAGLPVGRVFRGTMAVDDQGDPCARLRYWMVRTDVSEELDQRIVGGVIGEVSCAFGYTRLECSICKGDMWDFDSGCSHIPGQEYEGRRAMGAVLGIDEYDETSLVWMGAADGTRFRIAAARRSEDFARMVQAKRAKAQPKSILELMAAGSQAYEAKFQKLFTR